MQKAHFKANFSFPSDFIEGQTFFDPFTTERSKTIAHEKRFEESKKTQKFLKKEENES